MINLKNSRDAVGQVSNKTGEDLLVLQQFSSSKIVTLFSVVAPRRKKAGKREMEIDIRNEETEE